MGGYFLWWAEKRGIEQIKCGADEHRARRLDGAQPKLNRFPSAPPYQHDGFDTKPLCFYFS